MVNSLVASVIPLVYLVVHRVATLGGVANGADGPHEQVYFRGVASVPPGRRPDPETPPEALPRTREDLRPRQPRSDRGMIVRRRWKRLRAGAGWTWAGVTWVVICWGIWAASVRGSGMAGPLVGLVLVLATGALLFTVARLVGRLVVEQGLRRERPSAWPSHLIVCGFMVAAGIAFLQQTWWIGNSLDWIGDGWQSLLDTFESWTLSADRTA
jgi:hypothetical protein